MPNGFHETPEAAQERVQRAEQAEQDRRAKAEQLVDERLSALDQQVAENAERMARAKPTPTQREADLMKLGAFDIDSREDDGSGSEHEHVTRLMSARLPSEQAYETRAIESSGESSGRRGPGRPRKSEQPTSE